ncbi:hypothetical protein GGS24DRAFT_475071 [Hypoxylon argillaceum]|nr:hypothetical protein GGS24DRAFT_475071 [Hypoxylon argillaceum]
MDNLASVLFDRGRHKEAEALRVQVIEMRKAVLGPEHPDTLNSMDNLAHIWKFQGRNADAVELMEGCMQTRRRVLGPDHHLNRWRLDFPFLARSQLCKHVAGVCCGSLLCIQRRYSAIGSQS